MPDSHNPGEDTTRIKAMFQFILLKVLVEPEGYDIRTYLLYWSHHVFRVAKSCMVDDPECLDHEEALVLRDDRPGFVFHINIPGNNDMELVAKATGLSEVEEVPWVEDIKSTGRDDLYHGTTSMSYRDPSVRKQPQLSLV